MNKLDDLLTQVEATFRKFTIMPKSEFYVALALYVAYTHVAEAFDFAPRLLITSAEKRSGKTRTMELLVKLCRSSLSAANATTAALFRSLESIRTVCLDEADTIFGTRIKADQNEDLRGLVNAGFQRGGSVLRTVGPTHEVREFNTFSPVIMAAIGTLPDTISDRAVNIRLRRKKASENVSQYRARFHEPELKELHDALEEALSRRIDEVGRIIPQNPLTDRAADLWEPLLAVAELAGGEWPKRARQAAVVITETAGEDDPQSEGIDLLKDCKQIWEQLIQGDFVSSQSLLSFLTSLEESRWSHDLSPRRLSDMLRPYSIRPGRDTSGSNRGYKRSHFEDAFDRYLTVSIAKPSEVSETPELRGKLADTLRTSDTLNRQMKLNRQSNSPTPIRELDASDTSDMTVDYSATSDTSQEPNITPTNRAKAAQEIVAREYQTLGIPPQRDYCTGCGGPLPCHKQHNKTELQRLELAGLKEGVS